MGHVVGQDQEAFDQARQQHDDHREGDVGDQRPEPSADEDQAREGENRRDRRGKDRRGHAACGVFRRRHRVLAQRPVSEIGVFAHDDGVVHHDPQRDDQREKRDHVERQPGGIHQRDGRDQRHGDARRDPEGRARVEEQEQQPHHQRQAQQRVVQKDVQTARDRLRPGADQVDGRALPAGAIRAPPRPPSTCRWMAMASPSSDRSTRIETAGFSPTK
jgi:hypothetical protein